MTVKTTQNSLHAEDQNSSCPENVNRAAVLKFKKRMLDWPNPVEYVNNMYGAHPDDDDGGCGYFQRVFAK